MALASLPRTLVPLVAREMAGLETLCALASTPWPDDVRPGSLGSEMSPSRTPTSEHDDGGDALRDALRGFASFDDLVDTLSATGHGVVMTMGKGGVGKTTLAAQVAISLARRGHVVHLSTTDPAAHVAEAVGDDAPPSLRLSRIDPVAETARYLDEVLAAAEASAAADGGLLPDERALLAEDLRSPCTGRDRCFSCSSRARSPRRRMASWC